MRKSLHEAAARGDTDAVRSYVKKKASVRKRKTVEFRKESGTYLHLKKATPLHCAISSGNPECAEILLAAGADANALVSDETIARDEILAPLRLAVRFARRDTENETCYACMIRAMIRANADTGVRGAFGDSVLHDAARYSLREIVGVLIEAGADLDARNGCGETPLHCAVTARNPSVVALLVRSGADVSAADDRGLTPLHLSACGHGDGRPQSSRTTLILIAAGAKLAAPDEFGQTPLHFAAAEDRVDAVFGLAEAGAPLDALDRAGQTPLHTAYGKETVAALVALGADLDVVSEEGRTALDERLYGLSTSGSAGGFLISRGGCSDDEGCIPRIAEEAEELLYAGAAFSKPQNCFEAAGAIGVAARCSSPRVRSILEACVPELKSHPDEEEKERLMRICAPFFLESEPRSDQDFEITI